MKKTFLILLLLYTTGLITSLAGMEIFGSLISLFVLISLLAFVFRPNWSPFAAISSDVGELRQKDEMSLIFPSYFHFAIFGFASCVWIGSYLNYHNSNQGFESISETRWIILLYTLTIALAWLKNQQSQILKWFMIIGAIVAGYSIVQFVTNYDWIRPHQPHHTVMLNGVDYVRVRGLFSHVMSYAYSVGMLWIFFVTAIFVKYKIFRSTWLLYFLAFITTTSLALTFTRGAWVAAFGALFFIGYAIRPKLGLKVLTGATAAIALVCLLYAPVRDRVYEIYREPAGASSTNHRLSLWASSWGMFKEQPWFGVGYGQTKKRMAEFNLKLEGSRGIVSSAHNNYLAMLAGGGLMTFLFWIGLNFIFIRKSYLLFQTYRNDNAKRAIAWIGLSSFGAQMFFHLGGLTQSTFFDKEPLNLFIFCVALAMSYPLLTNKQNTKIQSPISLGPQA